MGTTRVLPDVLADLERRRQPEKRRLGVDRLGLLDPNAHRLVGVFKVPANLELGMAGLVDPLVEKPLQVLAGSRFHRLAEIVALDDLKLVRGHVGADALPPGMRRPASPRSACNTHAPFEYVTLSNISSDVSYRGSTIGRR